MKRRRPWLLISTLGMTFIGVTVAILWWYLPIAAPLFVFKYVPSGDPAERAVVRMVELIGQGQDEVAQVLTENHKRPVVTDGLVRALADRRIAVRRTAIGLVKTGQATDLPPSRYFRVPQDALVARLYDADAQIRLAAITLLRLRYPDRVQDSVIVSAIARDPDTEVRIEAARYLRLHRLPAIAALMLDDTSALIREIAVEAVGYSRDPTWIPPLVHLFDDPEPRVRIAAAKALGELDDERALPALIAGLRVTDPAVREAMVGALGRIEDIRAMPPLITALTDAVVQVRRSAANALGVIGDPRAITALARCSAQDADRSVRCAAVSALDGINDPATIDPLMQALKDPDPVVRAMAEAAIARRP